MSATAGTKQNKTPLEDLMAAMDVVDTIRHQSKVVARELDDEGRRTRLKDKLKELYKAQGIEVPDHVLDEGIKALEDGRFKYQSVKESFGTRLARLYIKRKRWGKPLAVFAMFGSIISTVHLFNEVLPERNLRQNLPGQIESSLSEIKAIAKNEEVIAKATTEAQSARAAIKNEKYDVASGIQNNMHEIARQLRTSYQIQIVSRPNESSGVWRIPEINTNQKNYYLIVEAVAADNKIIALPILNEETGKTSTVKKWGLRVNETTFYKVVADKNDDGIIQNKVLGEKPLGYLNPRFKVPTTGATITSW